MTLDEENVFSKLIISYFKKKKNTIIANLISIISKLETQCKCSLIYPIGIIG
jgi:hypothetical protein